MKNPISNIICNILIVILFSSSIHNPSNANDTINTTNSLRYNETLISSRGVFELGFFSPGSSRNWYVGLWYRNITPRTVVWVANRETPLRNSSSGLLRLVQPGLLVLVNETNQTIWSSNTSRPAHNPVARLLDTGNLVVRDKNDDDEEQENIDSYLWQSFDYPTDTFLVGMNFGWNYVTGIESYLSSWRTNEDPAPGGFTVHFDPSGYPQFITRSGPVIICRIGPWNGLTFSGAPDVSKDPTFKFEVYMNKNGAYYRGDVFDRSAITTFTLNPSGVGQRRGWVVQTHEWVPYLNFPSDNCDTYNLCGAYGSCDLGRFPVCGCLDKFVPRDPQGWDRGAWSSSGCVRRAKLNCSHGDGFLSYRGIKLPDARKSWYNETMSLEECEVECLRNCSCTAYTNLNISGGRSGCLIWFGELVDIRVLGTGGQDLYVRMASSELGSSRNREATAIIASTIVGFFLLCLIMLLHIWMRKKNQKNGRKTGNSNEAHNKDIDLPFFDLSTISKATNNFSIVNKLGQGGYGPVYKGTLEEGQDIAVKRLSKTSMQGLDEFKNEVICIAKLQHRNLVKLLGCCTQGEEKMLIYEYMPNKSLDLVLFDQTNRISLDWTKRFNVIYGIARGLMYLHQDSRLRIIHRDLKASNVLLDSEMNPKISDFGIAKRFCGNETGDKTSRVVGTYGYMSPEYAVHGRFSVKSDVFSFGVLVLEIVSGQRNSAFSHEDHNLNLFGHAWTLYREGRSIELVDANLRELGSLGDVVRIIHLGLLCVQQRPEDRPNMSSVVAMLSNDSALPQPNRPGFFTDNDTFVSESKAIPCPGNCTNEITITTIDGR